MNSNGHILNIILLNVSKVCRTCLNEKESMVNIFTSELSLKHNEIMIKVKDILNNITDIKLYENDEMPSQICNDCILNAITAYTYKIQIENADAKLREILKLMENTKSNSCIDKEINKINNDDIHSDCDITSVDVESVNADDLIKETEKPEICPENNNVNNNSDDINKEINGGNIIESSTTNNKFICNECNAVCLNEIDLKAHLKSEHFNKKTQNKMKQCKTSKSPVCIVCNQVFAQMQTLTRHMKIHQENQKNKLCTFCGKCFLRTDDLKRHTRIHTGERPYSCDQCPKRYKQSSELKEHQKSHSTEKLYMCTICGKSLATRNGLYVHMKVHRGEKNHQCKICDNKFVTSGELTSHMNHIHSSQKPYACTFEGCTRAFVTKLSLETHVRAHTGEKPFKCEICNKSLATASSLHEHKRTHTGEKPKQCNICYRRLGNSQALKKHIRIHTGERPYECKLCQEKFICGSTLNTHIKIKHLEKQYKCAICHKMFALSSKLRQHMRLHNNDKTLHCKTCNQTFSLSYKFLQHLKMHDEQSTNDNLIQKTSIVNPNEVIRISPQSMYCNDSNEPLANLISDVKAT